MRFFFKIQYFWKMGGAGIIRCKNCGFNRELVSFIHSFPMDKWNKSGYQCQSCGRFHEIVNDYKIKVPLLCFCGGDLLSEDPIFYPVCKKYELEYDMEYIT